MLAALLAVLGVTAGTMVARSPGQSVAEERLVVVAVDHASVRLAWLKQRGATRYRISRNGRVVAQTTGTSFRDVLLWPATAYRYRVQAWSRSGRVGTARSGFGKTRPLPASGFPSSFGAGSMWNRPLAQRQTGHPNSNTLVANWVENYLRNPNMTLRSWGVAVAEARPSDRLYRVPCTKYSCTLGRLWSVPHTRDGEARP